MEKCAYYEFRDHEDRHWWFIGRKAIFRHLLRHFVGGAGANGSAAPRKVFDLGCGMGGMLAELGEFGEVYGSDIAHDALLHCRTRGFKRLFRAGGPALPVPDASLDLVTAFDTIEHIPEEQETLAECFRALKPGGHAFFSVPAYQVLYTHQDRVVHHQRRYTARGLRRKLRQAGFEVVKASYINTLLFPVILPIVLAVKAKQAVKPPTDEDARSNVSVPVARWMNRLLAGIFSFERHLLTRVSMPAGHSLIAIARKPGGAPAR